MLAKYVLVKEIKSDVTKTNKPYSWIYDQDNQRWNLFNNEIVELNKSYVFRYEQNGEFQNVRAIEPLTNVFKVQALKEIANKNDLIRNYSIAMTQSIQVFAISQKMPTNDELFRLATAIYSQVDTFANSQMPKEV